MAYFFTAIFLLSLVFISFFLVMALINVIRKRRPKRPLISAGISAVVLVISFAGVGVTAEPASRNGPGLDSAGIEALAPDTTPNIVMAAASSPPTAKPENSTPVPTLVPTQAPTPVPTQAPTPVPTPEPTQAPTPVPTQAPTPEPTQAPTPVPTQAPTPEPTQAPTPVPTQAPTPEPTQAPTPVPTPEPTPVPTQAPTPEPTPVPAETPVNQGTGTGSQDNNFNTYDNADQQNTTDTYVLNINPKSMKIHYPSCRSVPKIAPQNYSTSSESLEELKARGFTTCGICFK